MKIFCEKVDGIATLQSPPGGAIFACYAATDARSGARTGAQSGVLR
jgi:hypothetical protein